MSLSQRLLLALLCIAALSSCGGGRDVETAAPQNAVVALRARALAVTPAGPRTPAPEEAALQLMDFGETAFPQFFPSRQPTQTLAPFVYRHYPQTGAYLGVVVMPGVSYEMLGVYVMGGPFGDAPQYVGPLAQFVSPQATRSEWLVQAAGASIGAAVQYHDLLRTLDAPALVVVDNRDATRWQVAEPAGRAVVHAAVFAADVDAATTEVRRLRERWRTYFRNGRLHRLDLEPAADQVPAAAQVSSFSTLSVCADDQQVFQNWVEPDRAWFVFPAPVDGGDCWGTRRYRAVRLGMAATDAPLTLNARPVDAVRDARGAIEGFILQEGDGQRILLADADFRVVRVLADSTTETDSMKLHRFKAYGVHGRGAGRYLLLTKDNHYDFEAKDELLALPLAAGARPVVVSTSPHVAPAVAEDDSGLYIAAGDRRLLHLSPDLVPRVLTESLPLHDHRVFLTPTRVVMVAGNINPQAVVSVPKSGGDPDLIATLANSGSPRTNLVVIGEDVYAQHHFDGAGVHVVRADGSRYERIANGHIAAALRPVSWFMDRTPRGFDYGGRIATFGADGAAALLIAEGSVYWSSGGDAIVRYDHDRVRRELGRLPQNSIGMVQLQVEPEASDVALSMDNDRRLAVHQIGGTALFYQRYVPNTTFVPRPWMWLLDPAGAMMPIDLGGAVSP